MPLTPAKILLILPFLREEFRQPVAELRARADLFECQTPRGAAEYLSHVDCSPVIVVIAQSRPGEFLSAELDRLAELAPLARFVFLLGSWCEGETRTGHVWPVATRVFWYDWPGESLRNLANISAGKFAPWLAPVTTLEEERCLMDAVAVSPFPQKRANASTPLILVCTKRSSYGDALCSAVRQQGYAACWQRPDRPERVEGVSAIVWEGIQLLAAEIAELKALAAAWPQTPILVLADFPRLETQERAIAAGAAALLAKPCSLADLLVQLDRWCPIPAEHSTEHAA